MTTLVPLRLLLHETRAGRRSVEVRAEGYLGAGFCRLQRLTDEFGGGWDTRAKKNLVPIAYARRVANAIHASGTFRLDVDAELLALMSRQRASIESAHAQVAGRCEALAARGLAPFPFQVEGARWLASRIAGLLADAMGLGKTVQALLAVPEDTGALVVCPACVKENWVAECARWRPDLRPRAVYGMRGFAWPEPGELVVANYEILPEVSTAPSHVVVVADEAHALKTPRAQRTKAFRTIAHRVIAAEGRVWLLTGTPMLNRPEELYHVLEAADLATVAFGPMDTYRRLFDAQEVQQEIHRKVPAAVGPRRGEVLVGPSRDPGMVVVKRRVRQIEWNSPRADVPERLQRVTLRRLRAKVLPELPGKLVRYLHVDLAADVRRACDRIVEAIGATGRDLRQVALTIADLARIEDEVPSIATARKQLAAAKLERVLGLVEEYEANEEPLVVFSAHREPIEQLGQREGWAAILGGVESQERAEIVRRFQAGELRGVALTIGAGGVGITLTRAAHALFVDLGWTPALNEQAEDRLARIGQTRGVLITHVVGNHVLEERVYEALAFKSDLVTDSVDRKSVLANDPVRD